MRGGSCLANFFIVDDEPLFHQIYEDILTVEHHCITGHAYDGSEAAEKIKSMKQLPDFIIMDHRMPIKSGIDATKEILKTFPKIKIIFISADSLVKEKALKSGAMAFLAKPINIDALYRTITSLMTHWT